MKKEYFFSAIIFLMCIILHPINSFAQNTDAMLNACSKVLNERNEALYDEVENYLLNIAKDSLYDLSSELLYHSNLSLLYFIKYQDIQKSCEELEVVYSKLDRNKHVEEFKEEYRQVLFSLGGAYVNLGNYDKAKIYLQKFLIESSKYEYDYNLYNTYFFLAQIYEKNNQFGLAQNCHDKCQEFFVRLYIHEHPEHSYYYDNYKTLKQAINTIEKNNGEITEDYINYLCLLGDLLYKVGAVAYQEPVLIFHKALALSQNNNLTHCRNLESCYVDLQQIYATYFDEPKNVELIETIIPLMIDYFSGALSEYDIYMSVGSALAVNNHDEQAIVYDIKALNSIDIDDENNTNKLKGIYQRIIIHNLGLQNDKGNQTALQYISKLKAITIEGDEFFDWCKDYEASILRYVNRLEESNKCLNENLKYYKSKYGKTSDQYIHTLNQLGLANIDNPEKALPFLEEAEKLITEQTDPSKIDAVSINLARCYMDQGLHEKALEKILISEEIEPTIYGYVRPLTVDIKNKCLESIAK